MQFELFITYRWHQVVGIYYKVLNLSMWTFYKSQTNKTEATNQGVLSCCSLSPHTIPEHPGHIHRSWEPRAVPEHIAAHSLSARVPGFKSGLATFDLSHLPLSSTFPIINMGLSFIIIIEIFEIFNARFKILIQLQNELDIFMLPLPGAVVKSKWINSQKALCGRHIVNTQD